MRLEVTLQKCLEAVATFPHPQQQKFSPESLEKKDVKKQY
jgi:hypothetical protein